MNTNQQRTLYGGLALIALGVFAALHLWWLLPVALFATVGATVYIQQRRVGRLPEAIQGGLWGVGLALLLLIGFFWSGILLLAGASLLARGREEKVDQVVQRLFGQSQAFIQSRRSNITVPTVTRTPTTPATPSMPSSNITIVNDDAPITGETTRLGR